MSAELKCRRYLAADRPRKEITKAGDLGLSVSQLKRNAHWPARCLLPERARIAATQRARWAKVNKISVEPGAEFLIAIPSFPGMKGVPLKYVGPQVHKRKQIVYLCDPQLLGLNVKVGQSLSQSSRTPMDSATVRELSESVSNYF